MKDTNPPIPYQLGPVWPWYTIKGTHTLSVITPSQCMDLLIAYCSGLNAILKKQSYIDRGSDLYKCDS